MATTDINDFKLTSATPVTSLNLYPKNSDGTSVHSYWKRVDWHDGQTPLNSDNLNKADIELAYWFAEGAGKINDIQTTVNAEITARIAEINACIKSINACIDSITAIRKVDETQDTNIENINTEISNIQNVNVTQTGAIINLDKSISTINSKDAQQDALLTELNSNLTTLQSKVNGIKIPTTVSELTDSSSYLKVGDATATYLSKTESEAYLKKADATTTYVTKDYADETYLTSDDLGEIQLPSLDDYIKSGDSVKLTGCVAADHKSVEI